MRSSAALKSILKIDPFCGETLQAAIEPEKPTTPVITTNVEQVDLIKLVNHFSLQGSSTGQAKNLAQHRQVANSIPSLAAQTLAAEISKIVVYLFT